MIVYYFIFLLVALNAFMIDKNRKYAIVGFLLFSIFYIFAARVGSDYVVYEIYYERMNSFNDLSAGGFEIGYNLLALVFHQLGFPFQVLHICIFCSIIIFFYKATKKMNLDLGIATLLAVYYIFYPSLEVLREGLALSLFFYSCTFLVSDATNGEKNVRMYFIINGIGFLFHRTAIIAFALYFFKKGKIAKIGTGAFLAFFTLIQPYFLEYLRRFPTFYNKLYYYLWTASKFEKDSNSIITYKLIEYAIALIALLYIILKRAKEKKAASKLSPLTNSTYNVITSESNEEEKPLFIQLSNIEVLALNLIGLGLIIQIFIAPLLSTTYRLVYYCDIGLILFYSILLRRFKNRLIKIGYILVLIVYNGIRLSRIFPFDNELFIYHFIF